MNCKIETYYALPCKLQAFTINGIEANISDFGTSGNYPDCDNIDYSDDILGYGCSNHIFIKSPTIDHNVLQKYNINEDEWDKIATELECKLHFGACKQCVRGEI